MTIPHADNHRERVSSSIKANEASPAVQGSTLEIAAQFPLWKVSPILT
jgi:hypothetical protein